MFAKILELPQVGQKIELLGINYIVEKINTPESLLAQGLVNLARYNLAEGVLAVLYLRRPNGKKHYMTSIRKMVRGGWMYAHQPISLR